MKLRGCKECEPGKNRKAPYPGPRCATHHRAKRKADAKRRADARTLAVYGITGEQYDALLAAQGGRCALCRIATGKARRLAVDHDHATGEVRGLICGPDNLLIGKLGDDPAEFRRFAAYLEHPPARAVLDRRADRTANIHTPAGGITLTGSPLIKTEVVP